MNNNKMTMAMRFSVPFSTVFCILFPVVQASAQDVAVSTAGQDWSLLESYCTDCHNAEDWAGSLDFGLVTDHPVSAEADIWEKALRKLRGRLMPPPGSPQPAQAEIDTFVSRIEAALDRRDGNSSPSVGHVPVQRLNRTEYAQAVKYLLGVDINAEDYLPEDIDVDGFDNIAAALSVSPSFLEQFITAARVASRLAVGEPVPKLASVFYPSPGGSQSEFQDGMPLGSRGGMKFVHNFPADGEYRFNILDLDIGLYPRAVETRHTLVLLVGGTEAYRADLGGVEDSALVDREAVAGRAAVMSRFSDIPVQVRAGAHKVVVTFIERSRAETDYAVDSGGARVPRVLDGVEVIGPFAPAGLSTTPSRQKIFICEPQSAAEETACANRIIANLARRAYRRPVTPGDMADLLPFYERGRLGAGGFDTGIEQAVVAVLASPDFLYRTIAPPRDARETAATQVFALSDLELASRLSFFLWSQGPDEELLELAVAGELNRPQVLEAQVRRMLADPRARALVENFAIKWLNLDDLDDVDPTPALFPGFSNQLREDFSEEVSLFIGSILLQERPVTELLTAQHSYLNERLARHYGIATVHGAQFRRVEMEDESRWGLFGKAAVLLRTSYGDRTSPVLRGAWVLDKLLGTPPAPPPPNVVTDLSVAEGEKPTTVRARLEAHRINQSCNQCHGVIDPIGLALENFSVLGQWRELDPLAQQAIDASTVMPSGAAINGPVELRRELMRRPAQFVQTLTEKLLMYSIGRELEYFDMPQVRTIVRAAEKDDYRLSAIITGIVNSDAFRLQSQPPAEADLAGEQIAVREG